MKLQGLFRELFQLDMADLDFGLYRLFNIKRHEIEDFLTKQLPNEVDEKFQILTEQDRADYREYLEKLEGKINDDFPPDTLLPNGDVNPAYRDAPLVKRYLDQKERIERIEASEEQKADVFNHLFNFFSRYYDEGDFIPKRFYGSRESYAVPYSGEEVFFHWANKDQHYVKSGENFRDYSFKVEGLGTGHHVRFALAEATTPRDNTKGEYRYFFPQPKKTSFDKRTKTLILPFEYRLPTTEEVQKYGIKTKGQDAILVEAVPKVMEAVPDDMLRDLLGEVVHKSDKEDVTLLLKRLRHFTRKNTTDYFIHKNLEGFLNQELEFYIKDQMLHLADLEADFDQKRLMLRVFRHLADTIITFLSQIEEVQKRLFEKKKFVLETNYCITLDRIPEDLYPEIVANDAQRAEWVKLFAIDEIEGNLAVPPYSEPLTVQFLDANPFLLIDTRFFEQGFKDKLLASFQDIDEKCDGIIVHSENNQALNLLSLRFDKCVECIFIDPPYNTGSDGFPYKDSYQHSSWLTMIVERLQVAWKLMAPNGTLWSTIDDGEVHRLKLASSDVFGSENFIANVVWQKKYTRANDAKWFSDNHDHILIFASNKQAVNLNLQPRSEDQQQAYSNPDGHPKGPWKATPLHAKSGTVQGFSYTFKNGITWSPPPGTYPRFSEETLARFDDNYEIWFGADGTATPSRKTFLCEAKEGVTPITIWDYKEVGHNHEAINELKALFPENPFPNPKPTRLIRRVIQLATSPQESIVLDFFSGSGTTANAVIAQNRADGGGRKYIQVEIGEHVDTVMVPRIKKVVYSKDWKDGKPVSREGISHMFKYIRLESYEDALHNLTSDGTMARIKSKEEAYKKAKGENEYRIRYLAKLPLEASDTMLNLARLEHPFNYTIEVLTDDGPREQAVDLVETFNFLYGLSVRRLVTWKNKKDGRDYRVVKATDREERKRILVVWRDMADLDPKIERKFLEGMLKEEDEFDEKLINGDTATPGFQSLDSLFKRLMEAG